MLCMYLCTYIRTYVYVDTYMQFQQDSNTYHLMKNYNTLYNAQSLITA